MTLRARGVDVVDTEVRALDLPDGRVVAYCVQPVLPSSQLEPNRLRACEPSAGHPAFAAIADAVSRVTDPRTGLDAQLSNWTWNDAGLRYLDVTTPILRDGSGTSLLDTSVFLAAFPWPTRAAVGRFVLPGVIERFTRPRDVFVDLLGNMLKERLDAWLGVTIAAVNERADPAISEEEVRRAYASDARLWRVMLALRRADRWWQRRVRRRQYPFLLPGRIER